jgi:lipoyl(octanoyl) transferase
MGLKGRDGTRTHIDGIPLAYTDRGGDITYHGPGQLVAYVLMDLQRRGWGPRRLVTALEQSVIELLAGHGIRGERRVGAPGVYTARGKIASLGLRVKQGRSYHGLALNIDMDLTPFSRIDPCGYPGQPVTQLADLGVRMNLAASGQELAAKLAAELGYTGCHPSPDKPPFNSL